METSLTSSFTLLRKAWSLALSRPFVITYLIMGAFPQVVSAGFAATISSVSNSMNLETVASDFFVNSAGWSIAGIGVAALLLLAAFVYLGTWYAAFVISLIRATGDGTFTKLSDYIAPARLVTIRLLTTTIKVSIISVIGLILLIIPGIIFMVRYGFAQMIAVLEDRSVNPLTESKRLVRGRFWKLVGRAVVIGICYNLPLAVLQSIHPGFGFVWTITSPVYGLYFYLVYADFKRTATPAA